MNDLSVVILGSGGTIPTRFRNLSAVVLKRSGRIFLFDAGEGTQIQFIKASLSMHKISDIFISHLHGDHIGGIPGILQSLSLLKRVKPMRIFGPKKIKTYISAIYDTMNFELTFPVGVIEVNSGIILDEKEFYVKCAPATHKIDIVAYGFFEKPRPGKFFPEKAENLGVPKPLWKNLQRGEEIIIDNRVINPPNVLGPERPGRKFVYAVDTRPCENVLTLSKGVDLLIHDGMFANVLQEKAIEGGHSTAFEAAELAKKAGVKRLILTHISSRYPNSNELLNEAQSVFPNVEIAQDLLTIDLPLIKN
ncbi:MAG: ribonuclease Z [Candidatus Helarchaeota archaeon]|nr:ribonuclease Z [Candidatus Helarchaeota archaeon]